MNIACLAPHLFLLLELYCVAATNRWARYHSHEELLSTLIDIHRKCPQHTELKSIGESVEGRSLLVIQFSTSPGGHEILKPEVKYVGNMHGNEPIGRELLLRFAAYLCDGITNGDSDVIKLLNATSIHILPSMNPDGFELAYMTGGAKKNWLLGRENANGVDLNRDFPDLDSLYFFFEKNHIPRFDHILEIFDNKDKNYQPETRAVGKWIVSIPFVLSANIHEGDLVANYPFDSSKQPGVNDYTASPDDLTFRYLAETYSKNHASMASASSPPCYDKDASFARKGGITNGAQWYSVSGGMQDFNYLATNAFEITLELSCEKFPNGSLLPKLWDDNKKSLIEFLWKAHIGIKGIILDALTGRPISGASIWIQNVTNKLPIKHSVTTWTTGDYFRLLTPGTYNVFVNADGYAPSAREVIVTNKNRESAQIVNFMLTPIDVENFEQQQTYMADDDGAENKLFNTNEDFNY